MIRSKNAILLNELVEMQNSPTYALRRFTLQKAEQVITDLETDLEKYTQSLRHFKEYCGKLQAQIRILKSLKK